MADGLMPVDNGRIRNAIQKRAMAGLDPTPEQAAWLKAQEPRQRENVERLADMLTPFPAIGKAIDDPSIGSITNAGVKTAMTAFRPLTALGILGGGFGAAAVKDSGLMDLSANAQSARQSRARAGAAREEARAAAAKAKAEADILRAKTEADRQAAEQRRAEADAELERQRKASEKAEYDRAVTKAEALRDQELKRDRRFSETAVGQVYDKTGGAAAFLAPFGVGLAQRIAQGPGGNAISKYVAPFVEGAAAAYGINSLPLYYDAYATEASNPTKQAYGVYGRELPAGHPRKDEALRYAGPESAGGMPDANPVRTTAQRELNDGFWKRLGMSAIEGTMAPLGYAVGGIPSRMAGKIGPAVEATAAIPGRAVAGYRQGMSQADTQAFARERALATQANDMSGIPLPAPRQQMPAQLPPQQPVRQPSGLIEDLPQPIQIAPPRPQIVEPTTPPIDIKTKLPPSRSRFDPAIYGIAAPAAGAAAAVANEPPEMARLRMLVEAGILSPSAVYGR